MTNNLTPEEEIEQIKGQITALRERKNALLKSVRKGERNEYYRDYCAKNAKKIAEIRKKSYEKHKEKRQEYARNRYRESK